MRFTHSADIIANDMTKAALRPMRLRSSVGTMQHGGQQQQSTQHASEWLGIQTHDPCSGELLMLQALSGVYVRPRATGATQT